MDLCELNRLNAMGKISYNNQKALIKKVLAGKNVACSHCKQPVSFIPANNDIYAKICCPDHCTDIELEIT